MCRIFFCLLLLSFASGAHAQTTSVYVTPTDDGFENYVTAAFHLKKVPVVITTKQEAATYVLTAAKVDVKPVSTGTKAINCIFASCSGNGDKASTSVRVTRGDEIVWSYSVAKGWGGARNMQSMAEAIAKHFHNDYLKKLGKNGGPPAVVAEQPKPTCAKKDGTIIPCPPEAAGAQTWR